VPSVAVPHSTVDGVVFPAIPTPEVARLLALLQQFGESDKLPEPVLRARQFHQLDALLRHVGGAVPFYAARLREAGFQPGTPISQEAWTALPILTRNEVQQAGAALHSGAVPPGHGRLIPGSTSGSTGTPIKTLKTDIAQFFWYAFTLREELWHGRDVGGKLAVIRRGRGEEGESKYPHGRRYADWGAPVATVYKTGPAVLLDIECSIAEQVDWLQREKPDYLLTFPSNLLFLARHCRDAGITLPGLRAARTLGEVVSAELRAICREVWGIEIADMYSTEELGYVALQCKEGRYHVQAEGVLVEILDEAGRPCRPGEIGRVIATPLQNYAMPLLRYAVGDYAELGEACPCGRTLPVLERVVGRSRDIVRLPSGERRFAAQFEGGGFTEMAAIMQHQIVQKSLGDIEVRLVARRPLTVEEEDRLRRWIRLSFGYDFRLRFVYCDDIPRAASGKYEDFRSELPT
jgi:phenylacetate-CoA ligase